ncbi:hypothetical protein QBC35DRAFT_492422, partial [Podospora australis]
MVQSNYRRLSTLIPSVLWLAVLTRTRQILISLLKGCSNRSLCFDDKTVWNRGALKLLVATYLGQKVESCPKSPIVNQGHLLRGVLVGYWNLEVWTTECSNAPPFFFFPERLPRIQAQGRRKPPAIRRRFASAKTHKGQVGNCPTPNQAFLSVVVSL